MAETRMRPNGEGSTIAVARSARAPLPEQSAQSGGKVADGLRGDDQPLYDRQVILPGTITTIPLFNLGQRNGRQYPDTNVATPNRVPGDFTSSIRGFCISVSAFPGDPELTSAQFFAITNGLFVMKKNKNARFRLHMHRLGGGGGRYGVGQGAVAGIVWQNGHPSVNDYYKLKSYIPLQAEDAFGAEIQYSSFVGGGPTIGTGPLVLTQRFVLEVYLMGPKAIIIDRG